MSNHMVRMPGSLSPSHSIDLGNIRFLLYAHIAQVIVSVQCECVFVRG